MVRLGALALSKSFTRRGEARRTLRFQTILVVARLGALLDTLMRVTMIPKYNCRCSTPPNDKHRDDDEKCRSNGGPSPAGNNFGKGIALT